MLSYLRLLAAVMLIVCFDVSTFGAEPVRKTDYQAEVLRDQPVAWWRLQDSTTADGAVVQDEMGRHPGRYQGGVTPEAGPVGIKGRAARFDGRRAFLDVPHHAEFALDDISVELWFRSTQPWQARQWPGSATLISKATDRPGSSDWTINAGALRPGENEGRVLATIGAAGSGTDTQLASGSHRNDGQWHHLVWTRTAGGLNCLYLDGRVVDQAEDEGGSITNERPIQIGGDPHERGTFLDGALAEVAVYAASLSADRVTPTPWPVA